MQQPLRRRSVKAPVDECTCAPSAQLLGSEGEGFKIAMATLDGGRIGIAAQALGIAQAAFECAISFAQEREAFDKPIAQLQSIQNKVRPCAMAVFAGLRYRPSLLTLLLLH